MTDSVLADLIKVGLAVLAAYITTAGFAPTVLTQYQSALEKRGPTDSQQKAFDKKFDRAKRLLRVGMGLFMTGYIFAGLATGTLILFYALQSLACIGFTCSLLSAPYFAAAVLIIALAILVYTAGALLALFSKAVDPVTED